MSIFTTPPFTTTSFFSRTVSALVLSMIATAASSQIVLMGNTVNEISADFAANSSTPAYTILNSFTLRESKTSDFNLTNGKQVSIIFSAPAGWNFKSSAGLATINKVALQDITDVKLKVTSKTAELFFKVTGTKQLDEITITGLQVQATNGAEINKDTEILRLANNPGTARIKGTIALCSLRQTPGLATSLAFLTRPGTSFANTIIDSNPEIITLDQFGNFTAAGLKSVQMVKIKISSGDGILNGQVQMNIGTTGGNGTVRFQDISISAAGTKKLMAISGLLAFAVTNEFEVKEEENATNVSTDDDPDSICETSIKAEGPASVA